MPGFMPLSESAVSYPVSWPVFVCPVSCPVSYPATLGLIIFIYIEPLVTGAEGRIGVLRSLTSLWVCNVHLLVSSRGQHLNLPEGIVPNYSVRLPPPPGGVAVTDFGQAPTSDKKTSQKMGRRFHARFHAHRPICEPVPGLGTTASSSSSDASGSSSSSST